MKLILVLSLHLGHPPERDIPDEENPESIKEKKTVRVKKK